MKKNIILQIILIITIIIHLFFWAIAYGSGHKVANDIDYMFLRNISCLVIILVISFVFRKK